MTQKNTTGLFAATFSPMKADGSINPDQVGPMVEHLIRDGVTGIFVCGSTGEGLSLTTEERMILAEEYVRASAGRLFVMVHVGHNSAGEAGKLAAHAARIGADAVSATAPSYFKVQSVGGLIDFLRGIHDQAGDLPFYYYHIPVLTGVHLDMVEFLEKAPAQLSRLAGLKYTTPQLHEFMACLRAGEGKFEVLYGTDEMMLGALAMGAKGFIGSTYNFAAPLYTRLIRAFEAGDLETAREQQYRSIGIVRLIVRYGPLAAQKAIMGFRGIDCGPVRPPVAALSGAAFGKLKEEWGNLVKLVF